MCFRCHLRGTMEIQLYFTAIFRGVTEIDSFITKEEVITYQDARHRAVHHLTEKQHIFCTSDINSSSSKSLTPIQTAHFLAGTIPSSVSINGLSNSNVVDTTADFTCADVNLFDDDDGS